MSFDLHLQHFLAGDSASIDPAPVAEVLSKQCFTGPDEFGFYRVEFVDGVDVEFSADGLDCTKPFSGCAFHVRGIGIALVQFVFDVASAGNFVIFNCQGDDTEESPVLILVSPDQTSQLSPNMVALYSSRPICTSAEMLGTLLFPDHDDWQDYRDHVVSD